MRRGGVYVGAVGRGRGRGRQAEVSLGCAFPSGSPLPLSAFSYRLLSHAPFSARCWFTLLITLKHFQRYYSFPFVTNVTSAFTKQKNVM